LDNFEPEVSLTILKELVQHKKPWLVFIGAPSRFMVKAVYSRETGAIAAVSSTQKLALIAGRYVGQGTTRVCIVRSQGEFPAVGEVLEPFAFPHLVEGWMRGSHHGPIMPTSISQSNPSRFDGPPRVVAAGFQLVGGVVQSLRNLLEHGRHEIVKRAVEDSIYSAKIMTKL
jgi:fructose 1,6-bisphosphate aldolase/phosphatase